MRRLPIFFLVCTTLFSCTRPGIIGHWRVKEFSVRDKRNKWTIQFDPHEKLLPETYEHFRDFYRSAHGFEMPPDFLSNLTASLRAAKFNIFEKGDFSLDSCDAIAPRILPGFSLSNPLVGHWQLRADSLIMSVPQAGNLYCFLSRSVQRNQLRLSLVSLMGWECDPPSDFLLVRQ